MTASYNYYNNTNIHMSYLCIMHYKLCYLNNKNIIVKILSVF